MLTSWLLLEDFLHSSGGIIATLTFYDLARMWVECIIIMPATIAIVALTFSIYALKPFFPECSPPDEAVKLLAVLCITILAFVNCWDVKWATTIQAQNPPFPNTDFFSGRLHLRQALCPLCHHCYWGCTAVQGKGEDSREIVVEETSPE